MTERSVSELVNILVDMHERSTIFVTSTCQSQTY